MKIALIAPLFISVPPKMYGGTEAVVFYLTEGLARRGHQVTLFANEFSKVTVKLDKAWGKQLEGSQFERSNTVYKLKRLDYIFAQSNNFDVVHNHDGIMAIALEDLCKCTMVTTWHHSFGGDIDNFSIFKETIEQTQLVSISDAQRQDLPQGNFVATVYNGTIDFNQYELGRGGDYLTWLGRFDESKGSREAIEIAQKAKVKLVLAGSIRNDDQKEYFNRYIKDKIDNKRIIFIGEADIKKKNKLMKSASACLVPISWREPFGLVMIEAMACGTPVIAYNRGSVPEIVEDGKNGFIVKDNSIIGAVEAVKKIKTIDRKHCRESVKKHFSIEKMVSGYEKVYEKAIKEYKKRGK